MTQTEQHAEKRAQWEERIAAYEKSNQSVRKWCMENNIPEHQMHYWLPKVRPSEQKQIKNSTSSRWMTLESPNHSHTGVSLRLGSIVLEVQRDFDQKVLADVVQSLITL